LIYLPMGRLADFLFGFGDPARANAVLAKLFARRNNPYSHQFAKVAEVGGKMAGLLLAYPYRMLKRLKAPMARQLVAIYGLADMCRFVHRSWPLFGLCEAEEDEYYICTLAVVPELQGKRIGARLLAYAEAEAEAAGLLKCSLGVEVGNDGARRFYERHGYVAFATVKPAYLAGRMSYPGFHRMVKVLSAPPEK
jgi:ribosomal protein S18 acetylase RimI-like enzyme